MNDKEKNNYFKDLLGDESSNTFDTKEIAKSGLGDIGVAKPLYDLELQNIYDTYQQNIGMLSAEKQKNIENAYMIREMSKKYLGEYASNAGIGDVSGNLLDIYGKYQDNIANINAQSGMLEMGLDNSFREAKFNNLAGRLQTQYNIDMQNLQTEAEGVLYDISSGNTGGLSDFEYLESKRETLGEPLYKALYNEVYNEYRSSISDRFESGFYGYKTSEHGVRELIETPEEFLETYGKHLNEKDRTNFADVIQFNRDIEEKLGAKNIISETIDGKQNPFYVGKDYDVFLNTGDPTASVLTGFAHVDADGKQINRFVSTKSVDVDNMFDTTYEDVVARYDELYELGEVDSPLPKNGDIISVSGRFTDNYTFGKKGETKDVDYIYRAGSWHRVIDEVPFDNSDMSRWNELGDDGKNTPWNAEKKYFEINGIKYVRNERAEIGDDDKKEIAKLITELHSMPGKNVLRKYPYVMYNGKIYGLKAGVTRTDFDPNDLSRIERMIVEMEKENK